MKKLKVIEQNCNIYFWSDEIGYAAWAKEFYDFIIKNKINRIMVKGKEVDIDIRILGRSYDKHLSSNIVEVEIEI